VAVCVVCFAISTAMGAFVAKLDDVFGARSQQGHGIGAAHLPSVKAELQRLGGRRIDPSVHVRNREARRFDERYGCRSLQAER